MNQDGHPDVNLTYLPADAVGLFRACEKELATGLNALPDKPEETVQTTLAALWHAAAGQAFSLQRAMQEKLPALGADETVRLRALLQRRIEGTPLAYLTGRWQFMGVELLASPAALIPRKETELLGYAALERLRAIVAEQGSATVIDVCTGSGNLALGLACHESKARVWGADLSSEAIELACRNATHVNLSNRVVFCAGDLLMPFNMPDFYNKVDLLVCNPPYISSAKLASMPEEIIAHEPSMAFDGGPLGISVLQRLITEAPRFLRKGGWLAFEVGLGQGNGVLRRIERQGNYTDLEHVLDQHGQIRAVLARAQAAKPS